MSLTIALPQIHDLYHDEQNTLDELIGQWRAKRARNNLRTAFYDMKHAEAALANAQVPEVIRRRAYVLGWTGISVDKLARRTNLEGFYDAAGADLGSLGLGEWMRANRIEAEVSQAGKSSLMHSVAFLVTIQGDTQAGEPEVLTLTRPATLATGLWSPRTRSLRAFLSITELDDVGEPSAMTMYLPNLNVDMTRSGSRWTVVRRSHRYGVPVDPIRYKPDLMRPFGRSRITRASMSIHLQAVEAMRRADVNGHAYSLPRYALLGATEAAFRNADGSPKPAWQAAWDAVWAVGDDEDMLNSGAPQLARADIKQFHGQSPEPQNAHLRMLAQMFSGETGIPVGELGIIGDANPTSAEALQVSRDDLIAEAERTTDDWSPDLASAMQRALVMKNRGDVPDDLDIRAQWRNPIHVSRAQAADAGTKIIDKFPWLAETEVGLELAGLTPDQVRRAIIERRRQGGTAALSTILERFAQQQVSDVNADATAP